MRFLVRKRRTTPAVIIVALIDVLIVLVIFLLVTTTFKQTSSLKVALPESSQSQKSGVTENPPLIVDIGANGVFVLDKEKLAVTEDQLRDRVKAEAAKNPDLILEMRADEKAPW